MKPRMFAVLAVAAQLAGCASADPLHSYTGRLAPAAPAVIASDLAGYVATALPPGKSTVWVHPAPLGKAGLTLPLENALRARGYAIAPGTAARPAGAHEVRYLVDGDGTGATARVIVDGRMAGRWYGADATGLLRPAGPFTVME